MLANYVLKIFDANSVDLLAKVQICSHLLLYWRSAYFVNLFPMEGLKIKIFLVKIGEVINLPKTGKIFKFPLRVVWEIFQIYFAKILPINYKCKSTPFNSILVRVSRQHEIRYVSQALDYCISLRKNVRVDCFNAGVWIRKRWAITNQSQIINSNVAS